MIIEGNETWCSVGPFCFIISYRNDGSYHYLDGKLFLGIWRELYFCFYKYSYLMYIKYMWGRLTTIQWHGVLLISSALWQDKKRTFFRNKVLLEKRTLFHKVQGQRKWQDILWRVAKGGPKIFMKSVICVHCTSCLLIVVEVRTEGFNMYRYFLWS